MGVAVVAVVVTHRGSGEMLEQCLASLRAEGVDTIVVDNSDVAQSTGDDPGSNTRTLVVRNEGFGAAANAGFEAARRHGADVFVLLNDDVVVRPGWLAPLVDELAATDVGAVQPLLVFAGTSKVNSLGVQVGADGAGTDIGLGIAVDEVGTDARDIEIFTGGAVAFRREFIDATGGFDERYFLYYEDVDLARRGAHLGWRYRCAPSSVVEHRKGASTDQLGDRLVYLRERNRLWSAFRNESASVVVRAVWLSLRRVRHTPLLTHLRALATGVAGGLWRLVERASATR